MVRFNERGVRVVSVLLAVCFTGSRWFSPVFLIVSTSFSLFLAHSLTLTLTLTFIFTVFPLKNNDGLIDFNEFITGLSKMSHAPVKEKMGFLFEVMDVDTDGKVSVTELMAMLRSPKDDLMELTAFSEEIMHMITVKQEGADHGSSVVTKKDFVKAVSKSPMLQQWFEQVGVIDLHPKKRDALAQLQAAGGTVSVDNFQQLKKLWAM